MIKNITIGADIEWFLRNRESSEIVSAEGYIPGTKESPHYFMKGNPYYATSLDNVLAEGNIPPANTVVEFINNIEFLHSHIEKSIPENLETLAIASARLDPDKYLSTETAQVFGCSKSYGAWDMEERVVTHREDNLRSAGFHIHIGYDDFSEETNIKIIKAMDLFLGVPSVIIEPYNERREVGYGRSGDFRNTPFGVEYRTLSSYMASTKDLLRYCYDQTIKALKFASADSYVMLNALGYKIQSAINNQNREEALQLLKIFKIDIPHEYKNV